ncbi:hypothetical protein NUW58_g7952 [Xylaria curta]|uniref:Uncharacterized protein n=1 Tax=Xylaria curta TaxID=42375 RepID=A0ACC1NCC4_9PEZI|nr:hypothetical protein NUW58_g7952 [Xylaria curta]
MEPYKLTATEALSSIRNRSLTVEQYARSLLSRIAERGPTVQAWEHLDAENVIREAKRLDQTPDQERGPLHGLPIARISQAPISIGSQTGGSTIRPGSFNGIYALKPTWNAISREGQKFYSLTLDTIGFFARRIEDLELIADVFGVEDDCAPADDFKVEGARFAVVKTPVWPEAGPGTISALEAGARLLRSHGAEVEEIELPPEFDRAPEWHSVLMNSEGRVTFLSEYRLAKEKLSPFLARTVENANGISRAAQLEAYDGIAALRPKIDEIAKKYAAILTPSVVDEAPVGIESTGSPVFNGMWTALHTPVVNIPGFKGANDMPIGLSLVAPRYYDRHLLAVSKAVGKIFESEGGWKNRF